MLCLQRLYGGGGGDLEGGQGLHVLTWPVVHVDLPLGLGQSDPQRLRPIPPERQQAVSVDTNVKRLVGGGVPHVVPDHLMHLTVSACMNRTPSLSVYCSGIFRLYLHFLFIKAIQSRLGSTGQHTSTLASVFFNIDVPSLSFYHKGLPWGQKPNS